MGIEYSSVVDESRAQVFAWHARPGAIHRLLPPWQPLEVVEEAASLADGRALLGLPGGLRWVADHQKAAYDPPARFVDALGRDGPRSLPVGLIGSWRHEHSFEDADGGRTRVTDRVDTPVPGRLLRSTFRYRHRQLAEDLAAHRRAREHGAHPTTVAVTGSSGLIGTALTAFLSTGGHRVIRLVRRDPRGSAERRWEPDAPARGLLDGVDAVVHLAGASIAGRFTDAHKAAVRDSRIDPTRRLAECAAAATNGPATFVSASAIGAYGPDRGEDPVDESGSRGNGFLADVVAEWESATTPATTAGLRVVTVRTGIVQTPRGGTLRLLRPLFAAGLGGRLGNGRQWVSWIDLDDLLDVYLRALVDPTLRGPVNATSPHPVRNTEYTRTSPGPCTGPRCCRYPASDPHCCSASTAHANSPRPTNASFPGYYSTPGTDSGARPSSSAYATNSGTSTRRSDDSRGPPPLPPPGRADPDRLRCADPRAAGRGEAYRTPEPGRHCCPPNRTMCRSSTPTDT